MKLLLFALLSISNGNYESNDLHDAGTVDGMLHDVGINVERRNRRNIRIYLKPWVLDLMNSRARDDRTGLLYRDLKIRAVSKFGSMYIESSQISLSEFGLLLANLQADHSSRKRWQSCCKLIAFIICIS